MRKNFLLLALFATAALTPAKGVALFVDPVPAQTYENVTCEAGKMTGDFGALYSRLPIYNLYSIRKSNVATASVAMTIDLSAAVKVTENTKLLTFDSVHELGLIATPDGITGNWHGKPWGETIPYGKLATHPAAFSRNNTVYISFTVVASGCQGSGWNGLGGIMGYDVNGDLLINLPLLASAENKDFKSITANPDLVKSVSVTPLVTPNLTVVAENAAAQAAKIERKFLKKNGEWLSPTQWVVISIISLIVLGLASLVCFRRGKWN